MLTTLSALPLVAHDFEVKTNSGQALFFNITDSAKNEVALTYDGSIANTQRRYFAGSLELPAQVRHNGTVYQITAIGTKAFSGDTLLTSVELPLGLKEIGEFAFEGCTSLKRVIFPGNEVKIETGAFFRCEALSQVTLGSDWNNVNLKVFRWSKQLKTITIPAKMKHITGMPFLASLERINVDENNATFASVDGVLYNRDTTQLLSCPRAFSGELIVPDSTRSIRWQALAKSRRLTAITLPAGLQSLSFREFAQLDSLQTITMKADQPIPTAVGNGQPVFLLQVANQSVSLVVNKKALKNFTTALVSTPGNYTEIKANLPQGENEELAELPYNIDEQAALKASRVVGIKETKSKK